MFSVISCCGWWRAHLNLDLFCRDGSQEVLFIDHKVRSQWGVSHICHTPRGLACIPLSPIPLRRPKPSRTLLNLTSSMKRSQTAWAKNTSASFEFLTLRDSSCFQPARAIPLTLSHHCILSLSQVLIVMFVLTFLSGCKYVRVGWILSVLREVDLMDTDPQVHGDEAWARLWTYGCVNTSNFLETQPAILQLSRDPLLKIDPQTEHLYSQQHFLKHLKSQRKSYLKPKSNQPQNAPFCVHFFSTPSHYFIIVSFHETPSSHSHLFSPLSNDKTTLLSSEKEMSSWREVEGHTRRLIRYCSLLAILLKTIYPRP